MIFNAYENYTPRTKDGYYIGDLTEEQLMQIDTLYQRGKVEALTEVLNGYTMKDYQTMLATIAYISKGFVVGIDTGLGKSLIISLYLKIHEAKGTLNSNSRALVVTTTSSLEQIKQVIEKSTGIAVFAISGSAKEIQKQITRKDFDKYGVYIVANSVFSKSVEFNRMFSYFVNKFSTLVIDESMAAGSENSILAETLRGWARHFEYKMLLNATVIEKRLEQPYNQFKLLHPQLMEPLEVLMKQYSYKDKKQVRYRNLDKLFDKLKYFFCNIDRQDIGATFEYEDILVPLRMTELQRKVQTPSNYVYALFSPKTQADTSVIPFTREHLPYLNAVLDILRKEFAMHDKGVVIYVEPTACKESLKKIIKEEFPDISVGIIDGTDTEFRQDRSDSFNSGETRVLIINIPEALDLHNGRAMIFLNIPSKHYQARGRIARGMNSTGEKLRYYYPIYVDSYQLNYIKDILTADELILSGALSRHIETSRNLMSMIKKLNL